MDTWTLEIFKLKSIIREKEDYFIITKFLQYYPFGPTYIARLGASQVAQ